jgi:hypothetical protein
LLGAVSRSRTFAREYSVYSLGDVGEYVTLDMAVRVGGKGNRGMAEKLHYRTKLYTLSNQEGRGQSVANREISYRAAWRGEEWL